LAETVKNQKSSLDFNLNCQKTPPPRGKMGEKKTGFLKFIVHLPDDIFSQFNHFMKLLFVPFSTTFEETIPDKSLQKTNLVRKTASANIRLSI
jgi:hypothetical protein